MAHKKLINIFLIDMILNSPNLHETAWNKGNLFSSFSETAACDEVSNMPSEVWPFMNIENDLKYDSLCLRILAVRWVYR